MSRHTGIELTEADVPPERREAWRQAKAMREERMAIKADLAKREIEIPPEIGLFDLSALRRFHQDADNTPSGRYAAIRRRYLEGKGAK